MNPIQLNKGDQIKRPVLSSKSPECPMIQNGPVHPGAFFNHELEDGVSSRTLRIHSCCSHCLHGVAIPTAMEAAPTTTTITNKQTTATKKTNKKRQ